MTFVAGDIRPAGPVPGTTAQAYVVSRGGREIGVVHVPGAPGMLNAGQDVIAYIVSRLNEVEQSVGRHELDRSLASALQLD